MKELFTKHQSNGLLIDTNLLLLLAIGVFDEQRIERFKRTYKYSRTDFENLVSIADRFSKLWTTPNILTEVENLGRQLPSRDWPGFAAAVRTLNLKMIEVYVASSIAMQSKCHSRLGLADSATLNLGRPILLLTDDIDLYLEAARHGVDSINFNHLRELE